MMFPDAKKIDNCSDYDRNVARFLNMCFKNNFQLLEFIACLPGINA